MAAIAWRVYASFHDVSIQDFMKHCSLVLTSVYFMLRTAILQSLTVTLNLWFLIRATRTDIWTSTMSPTFIAQGVISLNLICGNYKSRWHIVSVIIEAHCFELLSLVQYKTTLSSLWKRSPPANAVSHLVGSTSGMNGMDREWGSSILCMKYPLLSSINGFLLYVVGCHSSRTSFLIWHTNKFCLTTKEMQTCIAFMRWELKFSWPHFQNVESKCELTCNRMPQLWINLISKKNQSDLVQ